MTRFLITLCSLVVACQAAPPLKSDASSNEQTDPPAPTTCAAETPEACWEDGRSGIWDAATREAGLTSLGIACDVEWEGRVQACTLLHMHGDRQQSWTIDGLDQLCEQGERMACAWWAMHSMGKAFGAEDSPEVAALRAKILARIEPACARPTTKAELDAYRINAQALACNSAAPLYEHGMGVDQDHVKAFGLWSTSCESGDAHGCAQTAFFMMRGLGTDKEPQAARELYATTCERPGGAMACANLASIYLKGDGVAKDPARAAALYERACKEAYMDSCQRQAAAEELAKP